MSKSSKTKLYRNLKKGDKFITPVVCFPTTLNPLIQNGLEPVFVDVTLPDLNIDLEDVVNILNTKKVCLKETLIRTYIINKDYKVLKTPNKIGSGGSKKETILITTICFKNLCMSSKGKNGMIIRNYLNEINIFIMKNYEKLIKNDT
jgi:hypothetical protein